MENASKALIIAGAILLAIIIISLGIMVVNNARGTVGNNNLSKQEVEVFNSTWDGYAGTNKSASDIRSLYSAVIANNASEKSTGNNRTISVIAKKGTGSNDSADVTTTDTVTNNVPTFSSTDRYSVTITGYATNGCVNQITISK